MMKKIFQPLSLSALMLVACSQGGSKPADTSKDSKPAASQPAASQPAASASSKGRSAKDREARDADGVVRRGTTLSDGASLSVTDVHAQVESLKGKSVKVVGEVSSVCKKSGCWFILRDGDKSMRITMKDYAYFVPSDVVGMQATVEGELSAKTLDQETAQHFADDEAEATGGAAKKVEGPVYEVAIASVGLRIAKPDAP